MRADYVARNLPVEVAASVAGSLGSRLPLGFESRTAYVAEERPLPKQAGRALVAAINMFGSVQQAQHTVPRHILHVAGPDQDGPLKTDLHANLQLNASIYPKHATAYQYTPAPSPIFGFHLPPPDPGSKHDCIDSSSPLLSTLPSAIKSHSRPPGRRLHIDASLPRPHTDSDANCLAFLGTTPRRCCPHIIHFRPVTKPRPFLPRYIRL